MARKKHQTVSDVNQNIIAPRIDDNFGLRTILPSSLALSSGVINLDSAEYTCNVVSLTTDNAASTTGVLLCIQGGQIGQTIVIINTTGGQSIELRKEKTASAGTTHNIVTPAGSSGSHFISTTTGSHVVLTKVSTYWVVNSSST